MAKNPTKSNGEPTRIKIPQQGSKPLLVVVDDDGQPVMEHPYYLAWHKATGTFYVGGKQPREYLKTRDRLQAIYRFREWVREQGTESVAVKKPIDGPEKFNPDEFLAALRPISYVVDSPDGSEAVTHLPSVDFWRTVRELVLSDPEQFRRETGLKIVDDQPKPSVTLNKIHETYLAKRKQPKPEELRKVKRYWNFFTKAVSPATRVKDVDAATLEKWENKIHDGGSPKTIQHRLDYVFRLFNYAATKQVDADECKRILDELRSMRAELPDLRNPNPNPISVDDFHQLLDGANDMWKAMLLTALNLCYYGCDIRRLPKAALDFKNGWVIFDRAKTGQTTRVGVLWRRTIKALQTYLKSRKNRGEYVFISQYGVEYTAQGLRTAFKYLRREKTQVDDSVELAHIRDGAYTAAIQGGATETITKILAGHKIKGMSDAYIKRNPLMVADACKAIEKHYFSRSKSNPKKSRKK